MELVNSKLANRKRQEEGKGWWYYGRMLDEIGVGTCSHVTKLLNSQAHNQTLAERRFPGSSFGNLSLPCPPLSGVVADTVSGKYDSEPVDSMYEDPEADLPPALAPGAGACTDSPDEEPEDGPLLHMSPLPSPTHHNHHNNHNNHHHPHLLPQHIYSHMLRHHSNSSSNDQDCSTPKEGRPTRLPSTFPTTFPFPTSWSCGSPRYPEQGWASGLRSGSTPGRGSAYTTRCNTGPKMDPSAGR
ncbi:hypothetical protein WMY93_027250 [Mugilogobius chulae]|uniref:Uncharacterized protein n=1 Tax=Mugilogobius chulae TaxID=88201 RepID=A0AAW0N485_9GOBI